MNRRPIQFLSALAAMTMSGHALGAQICQGTPPRGGAAFEFGMLTLGSSVGASGTLAGRRTAISAGFRARTISSTESGNEAGLRFALVLGSRKLSICPGIGFGYRGDTWKATSDITVKSTTLAARAGAGIGYELLELAGIDFAPYLSINYQFSAAKYDLDVASGEVDTTGDTLSTAEVEWGLSARYKFLYSTFAYHHSSRHFKSPYMARLLLGVTFSGASSKARATPGLSRQSADKPQLRGFAR